MGREDNSQTVDFRLKTVGPRLPATRQGYAGQAGYWLLTTLLALVIVSAWPARGAVTIDLVPVGDAGNAGELSGDPSYGTDRICGAVPYDYQIGTYEVTNAQYMAFLNSVARFGDTYGLYSEGLELGSLSGIGRTGAGTIGDPYAYLTRNGDPNWTNKPVGCVSWYNSLRFINWLQNGQPMAEAGPGVTETGTYTIGDPSTITDEYGDSHVHYPVTIPDHSALAPSTWVLPTEDEWYKAAYYKGGGTAAGYWDYATQSDTLPNYNPPWLDTGNSANYTYLDPNDPNNGGWAVGPPYYMTDVGAYTLSDSAYGTYDQNGNVYEVVETAQGSYGYPIRGGAWDYYQEGLPASDRSHVAGPDQLGPGVGFRVAAVPEPAVTPCLILIWAALRRRGRPGSG